MTLWSCDLARSRDKPKSVYLHEHSAYGHETSQGGDLFWRALNDKVIQNFYGHLFLQSTFGRLLLDTDKRCWEIVKEQSTKAAVCVCFTKQVFLKISQNSQENTCVRVSFLINTLLKKRHKRRYFPVSFKKFLRTPFSQNTSGRHFFLSEDLQHQYVLFDTLEDRLCWRIYQAISINWYIFGIRQRIRKSFYLFEYSSTCLWKGN